MLQRIGSVPEALDFAVVAEVPEVNLVLLRYP
jgi:hypothetical protein